MAALPAGSRGLPKPSVAICHQATTLGRAKLTKRIGALPAERLSDLESGIRATINLD